MYAFRYVRANSVSEAAEVVAGDPDAKLLAGGQSLVATMKLRLAQPSVIVDLGRGEAILRRDDLIPRHSHIDLAIGLNDIKRESTQSLPSRFCRSRRGRRSIGRIIRLNTHHKPQRSIVDVRRIFFCRSSTP